jgi:hypothetical protein
MDKPKKKDKLKKKQKQKQKQKQIVKTNVKVQVSSSGGSGGSGPIPSVFRDTAGENIRLTGLIEQALGSRVRVAAPVAAPTFETVAAPANDAATVQKVFMGKSDLDKPLTNKGAMEAYAEGMEAYAEGMEVGRGFAEMQQKTKKEEATRKMLETKQRKKEEAVYGFSKEAP